MRIKKQYIKYLLCLAPFLLSAIVYVQLNASFANILLFLKMIAFIYILCEHLRSMSLTKLDFSFAIYFFIWLFSIIINGESVIDYGTVKYYAQIHLQVWQNSVCTGQENLPLIT